MKRLVVYLFGLLLVLMGCTTAGERARMRAGLDSINHLNRTDQPFAIQDVEPYVRFFDNHGNPNDRLLAHYLLGRAYYEHGEAPMALQCYHNALDCADTTSQDCDYAQLARVYGQMAEIFYYQGLYRQQLEFEKQSVRYAWLGKDTLTALMNYEQESFAYKNLGMADSAIFIIEDVASKYRQYGYSTYAAISLYSIIRTVIQKGEFRKAKQYMDIYESKSGLFDTHDNIAHGREIYYNTKGCYYLETDRLDSAEYYFHKELNVGKDFNNQHGGAKGLAELYLRKNQPDSMAKYYRYAYIMNDSVYERRTAKEVKRIQDLYDYSRNQKIAQKKSEEARHHKERLRILLILFIGFAMIVSMMAYRVIRKRKENLYLYKRSLDELKQLRMEKAALYLHQEEYSQIIMEKDNRIAYLEQRVKKYGKQIYFKTANAERCLKESPIYKDFEKKAFQGLNLTEEDWKKITILIHEYLPSFDDFMATNQHRLKLSEYRIMLLLRLHFKATDISGMIAISKSQVSQNCTEIMKKVFNDKGSSKELSARIGKIY